MDEASVRILREYLRLRCRDRACPNTELFGNVVELVEKLIQENKQLKLDLQQCLSTRSF